MYGVCYCRSENTVLQALQGKVLLPGMFITILPGVWHGGLHVAYVYP